MRHQMFFCCFLVGVTCPAIAQVPDGGGLIINEINQGPSGTKEFIEMLVLGDPADPCATVDLSNWVIDDNNGSFDACGSGVGIATGHYRLTSGCYNAVPPGSILVLYNAADDYPGLPADDPEDSDGDGVYIIPSNSSCLEANFDTPTAAGPICTYSGPYSAPSLTWLAGMSNGGDVAQTRTPDYTFFHGFSYGDVSGSYPDWPDGAASGSSFNIGSGGNHALGCGNFYSSAPYFSTSGGGGTPGEANNADNADLITALSSCTYDYETLACCTIDSFIIDLDVCEGEGVVLPDGTFIPIVSEGLYTVTLDGTDVCDSVVGADIHIIEATVTELEAAVCEGESYVLPDGSIADMAGEYSTLLTSVEGCDSTVIVTLDILSSVSILIDTAICAGEEYVLPDGSVADAAGLYEVAISTPGACDSLFTVDLGVIPATSTSTDVLLCEGESYTLPDGTEVTTTGIYEIVLTGAGGCDSILVFNVDIEAAPVITLFDTPSATCIDAMPVILEATPSGGIWTGTGVSGDSFDPSLAGAGGPYLLTYTLDYGTDCSSSISFEIEVYEVPGIVFDLPLQFCLEDSPYLLDASPAGGTFSGPGVSGGFFDPGLTGTGGPFPITYDYTDGSGCTASLTVNAFVSENSIDAGPDTTILLGTSYSINLTEPGATYTWTPAGSVSCSDCANPVFTPTVTTTYSVTSTDVYGCTATDELTIYVDTDIAYNIYVPNAFSPNGDGINDVFNILGNGIARVRILSIYDRWGNIIFRSELAVAGANGWDGTYNGRELNIGVYVWVAEVELLDGNVVLRSGNVTLVK